MKRKIAVLLAAIMTVSVISGCGGKKNNEKSTITLTESGYPISNEKIVLEAMGEKNSIQGEWNNLEFFKKMEEITNIHFNFQTPTGESYKEVKNLTFAGDDLPDVFIGGGFTENEEVSYGHQKLLIPLEDLIDKYAPNIKKMLKERPDIRKAITTPDGHIYALPMISDVRYAQPSYVAWFNGEWLENLGVSEVPDTIDGLYDLLVRFKNEDPNRNGIADEIPMSSAALFGIRDIILTGFGFLNRGIEVHDDKVIFTPAEENYKHYLEWMHKLYQEGLLDKEVFTQTTQQWSSKGHDNLVGLAYNSGPHLYYDVKNNEYEKYKALPPLTSQYNSKKIYPKSSGVLRGTFAITKNNPSPEATIRWVDYMYSDEGCLLAITGGEWKYRDETKKKIDIKFPVGQEGETYRGGKLTPYCGGALPVWYKSDIYSMLNDDSADYLEKVVADNFEGHMQVAFPPIYMENEEQKELQVMLTDINTYVDQMEAKFISGQTSLDKWDEYINELKIMNVDRMIEIYQGAYDRNNK